MIGRFEAIGVHGWALGRWERWERLGRRVWRCGFRIRMRWYRASSISVSGPEGDVSFVMYLAVVSGEHPAISAPSAIAVARS